MTTRPPARERRNATVAAIGRYMRSQMIRKVMCQCGNEVEQLFAVTIGGQPVLLCAVCKAQKEAGQ